MKLDKWQKEVLAVKGNLCLCSGRQVGKSTVIAIKAGESAVKSKKTIMVVAHVERQALLLFEKILSHIYQNYKHMIKKPHTRNVTKHKINLTNGSVLHCLPTGDSGYGIRGYTIDELYADEAHFIKEDVWAAVTPMLATTGGNINLLSTPFGSLGYFYRCFHDDKFTRIHVSTENVAEDREEPQRTSMLEFLKDEKERMTKLQYQQEYLGLFVGGIQRFFPDELIESSIGNVGIINGDTFCGVDVARMGGDDTVLVSVKRYGERVSMIDLDISTKTYLTETVRLILRKDKEFSYKKIYIDTGGMGVGVFDPLLEHSQTRRKVVSIDNAKRSLDIIPKPRKIGIVSKKYTPPPPRKTTLVGEDSYMHLRNLMEKGLISLPDIPELRQSLRCIQYENSVDGGLKIYGNYDHICEALKRAVQCTKDKSLNILSARF